MSDQTPAFVRTGVPLIVGPVVAALGFSDSDPVAVAIAAGVIGYLYYVLVRLLEWKAPRLGWLLGIAKAPAYSAKEPPQPAPNLAEERSAADATFPEIGAVPFVPLREREGLVETVPEQTDNRPRPEDGPQFEDTGMHDWTGEEMR